NNAESIRGKEFITGCIPAHAQERARAHFCLEGRRVKASFAVLPALTREGSEVAIRWSPAQQWTAPSGAGLLITSGIDFSRNLAQESLVAIERARLAEAQRIAQIGSWELNLIDGELQ